MFSRSPNSTSLPIKAAEVVINVLDHPVDLGGVLVKPRVEIGPRVLIRDDQRRVRRVRRNIGEERFISVLFDERQSGVEEDIGAVALRFEPLPVLPEKRIEIGRSDDPVSD